jgi:hypothetical protein
MRHQAALIIYFLNYLATSSFFTKTLCQSLKS